MRQSQRKNKSKFIKLKELAERRTTRTKDSATLNIDRLAKVVCGGGAAVDATSSPFNL